MRGNCYVASEALFHLLGGKAAGWKPMRLRHGGGTHWFLLNTRTGQRLDATAAQFGSEPPYDKARGAGFLTKGPSGRARELMGRLLWQPEGE